MAPFICSSSRSQRTSFGSGPHFITFICFFQFACDHCDWCEAKAINANTQFSSLVDFIQIPKQKLYVVFPNLDALWGPWTSSVIVTWEPANNVPHPAPRPSELESAFSFSFLFYKINVWETLFCSTNRANTICILISVILTSSDE